MENTQDRVLAYNLAKVIDNEELAAVSGGSGHSTTGPTGGASGGSGQGGEAHIDIHWDF